jgi:hypothetical protein
VTFRKAWLTLTVVVLTACSQPVLAGGAEPLEEQPCAPTPDAGALRLVVAPGSIAAGQAAHYRIDNSTGPPITYGTPFSIQECVAGVWVLASFNPSGPWTKPLFLQRPGRGRWRSVQIPTKAAAGDYRIRKSVRAGGRGRWLYGEFVVVG